MIVVLGGSGFIGNHLRDRLRDLGHPFTTVSRRVLNTASSSSGEHHTLLQDFEGPAGDDLLREATCLVHLASRSVPATFAAEPWREVPENVAPASQVFIRCARVNPAMRVVYISSGGTVYGRFDAPRADETTPIAPISGYGLAKVMIEEALRFAGRISGMPTTILRVSNPVGLHQTSNAQGIVSIALRAARQGTAMKVFGDGSHVRDYVDADDVADAIIAACLDRQHCAATWNVGSGTGRSILEVLALAERVTGRRVSIEWHPPRAIDVPRIVLNCERIRRDLGWHASRGLDTAAMRINATLAGMPGEAGL